MRCTGCREPIHLTGKPFETLVFLVQNQGRTVKKETLLDAVWKDLFVTENNLERAISEVRRALGDDRERPAFIQTIPRQGYRFVATVISPNDGEHPRRRATDALPAEIPPRISLVSHAPPGAESQRPASILAPGPGSHERRPIRWRLVAVLTCCAFLLARHFLLVPEIAFVCPKGNSIAPDHSIAVAEARSHPYRWPAALLHGTARRTLHYLASSHRRGKPRPDSNPSPECLPL